MTVRRTMTVQKRWWLMPARWVLLNVLWLIGCERFAANVIRRIAPTMLKYGLKEVEIS